MKAGTPHMPEKQDKRRRTWKWPSSSPSRQTSRPPYPARAANTTSQTPPFNHHDKIVNRSSWTGAICSRPHSNHDAPRTRRSMRTSASKNRPSNSASRTRRANRQTYTLILIRRPSPGTKVYERAISRPRIRIFTPRPRPGLPLPLCTGRGHRARSLKGWRGYTSSCRFARRRGGR